MLWKFLFAFDWAALIIKQWICLSRRKFQSHRLALKRRTNNRCLSWASNDRWIRICYRRIHKSLTPFMAEERLASMILSQFFSPSKRFSSRELSDSSAIILGIISNRFQSLSAYPGLRPIDNLFNQQFFVRSLGDDSQVLQKSFVVDRKSFERHRSVSLKSVINRAAATTTTGGSGCLFGY